MRAYAAPYPKDVWGPRRARIIAVGLALVFTVIVGRSAYVAFNGPDRSAVPVAAVEDVRRADIVDRRGELLATTVEGTSLAVDPSAIWDSRDVVAGIRTVFPDLREDALTAMMADKKRQFAWVKRGLDDEQIKALKELGVEGLMFVNEAQRRYPGGSLAGHFLGYTSIDGDGLEGVERVYDERLKQGGEPLQLTLDASVQFVVEEELDRAFADFDMKGAAGIVLDAQTGAVRAIASWPHIDPRLRGEEGDDAKTNRALNARMELGSIYKPLTVAAALEAGVLQTSDTFDVSAPVKIGAVTVRDQHPLTRVSGKAATAEDISRRKLQHWHGDDRAADGRGTAEGVSRQGRPAGGSWRGGAAMGVPPRTSEVGPDCHGDCRLWPWHLGESARLCDDLHAFRQWRRVCVAKLHRAGRYGQREAHARDVCAHGRRRARHDADDRHARFRQARECNRL